MQNKKSQNDTYLQPDSYKIKLNIDVIYKFQFPKISLGFLHAF